MPVNPYPDPIFDDIKDDQKALDELEKLLDLMAAHEPLYSNSEVARLAKQARRFLVALRNLRASAK